MNNYFGNTYRSLLALMTISMLMSCSDTISTLFGGGEIEQGETVVFNTMVPDIKTTTRSAKSEWETKVKAYEAVNRDYTFNIEMWKDGDAAASGISKYKPISTDKDGEIEYNKNGTLQAAEGEIPLYWQDNVSKWGFKATSVSSTDIEADQSDQKKWLFQDKLVGYSYLPIWNGDAETGSELDNVNNINYRTSKQWYADNKTATQLSGLMVESNEDYKQIPLYLQHQRSWVTIILKAGEGVTREALAYATSEANIHTTIFSYKEGASTPFEVTKAWSSEALINYDSDKNGDAATGVSTTRYDAIVEPHNFIATKDSQEKDIIARINVSNQNFTFAANNDFNYGDFVADGTGTEAAKEAMKAYNLEPGKHLTITATLSRASRMVMITAWIEDWTETVTSTICDDYGQNGDPILINNETELKDFLTNTDKNKPGNVGLIVPNILPLSSDWNCSGYSLKATLNLAGAKLTVSKQFLNEIEGTGSLVNGEVSVAEGFNGDAAIATINHGTVERIRITTSGENTTAKASKAGVVVNNYGTIYQCTSALPVYGTGGYVGGIAATNLYYTSGTGTSGTIPVIDDCTVTARVDGSESVTAGGGIVGQAEGRVSNNTFEYGITLLQNASKFQNIIAAIGNNSLGLTMHSNNSWPIEGNYTISGSEVNIVNSYVGQKYNAVIDNQNELKKLLTSEYNQAGRTYRIAGSFTVNKDADSSNWIWGTNELNLNYFKHDASSEDYSHGNVKFKLEGNDKTITLTGTTNATMLFGTIIGEVYNLNLVLDKPILAARIMEKNNTGVDTNTDAIAALAYDVYGAGKLSNITLKGGDAVYIQSSTPAGIAVWASEGGTLVNCASNVKINMQITSTGSEARRYAGGIVACAQKATISQCKYYNNASDAITWSDDNAKSSTLYHYGGIVGGTSELADTDIKPLLVINDCSSWWTLPTFGENVTVRPTMGSLIGTTLYHEGELLKHAMAEGNAGNWWQGTVGAGKLLDGMTEIQAIGRKNSVPPTKPQGW